MPSASVTVRIDESLKKQAETLFSDMGLTMTTAFTLFVKAVVRHNRIPFEIAANTQLGETKWQRRNELDETKFASSMRESANDEAFIKRTHDCQEDFKYVDGEVIVEW